MIALIAAAATAITLQQALDRRVAAMPGTGIVVGIIDRGVQRTYVAGSDGKGRPVDSQTLFELGSVTKTFTATVLAQMALTGQVRLNDPISKYLPATVKAPTKDGKAITLLDLAEQRSGLPRLPTNMNDVAGDDPYADYTTADMFAFLNGYTLTRDPGASYEYSNYGVGLLGQLLANRAGVAYPQLLRQAVLGPLNMRATTFAVTGVPDPPSLAVGHDVTGAQAATWHAQAIVPAGLVVSNLDDMLRYLRCNMGTGRLARTCLFAQQPRAQGEPGHRIGLIWNINSRSGVIAHDGDTNGFHAAVAISRDRTTGVVVLSNGPLIADIAAHVMVPSFPIATCPASVPAALTNPQSYAGVYCNAALGTEFTVSAGTDSKHLSIALLPQPSFVYQQTASDTYARADLGATFKFVRNGGNVVGLWLLQGGQTIPSTRLDGTGRPMAASMPPLFPPAVALDPALLAQYAGSYSAGSATFTVTVRGGTLFVQLTGQPAAPVYASAKDQFYYKIVDAQISFGRDAAGNVDSLTLHQNGRSLKAARSTPR